MKKSIFRWGFVLCMLVGLMTIAASAAAPEKTVCNGHPTAEDGEIVWIEIDDVSDLGTLDANGYYRPAAGHYVLTENIDLGAAYWYTAASGDTVICLNGHTISSTATGNFGVFRTGAADNDLTVCDCLGGGKVVAGADVNRIVGSAGGAVLLQNITLCTDNDAVVQFAVRPTAANAWEFDGCNIYGIQQLFRAVTNTEIKISDTTVSTENGFCYRSNNKFIATVTFSNGTFNCSDLTVDEVTTNLAKDVPLCVEGEDGNVTVKQGFYRDGSKQDFSTKLQFRLYLKCDNDIFSSIDNGTSAESLGWSVERSKGAGTMYSSGSQFVLIVGALTAKDIGTPVTCTVKDADGTVLFEETISAADVAKEIYDGTADEAVKTLMEDLVNYGNAAVEAFGGTPVDALGEGTTVLTQDWTRGENAYGVTNGDHDMYATLSLKNTIELNIYHEDAEGNVTHQTLSDIAIANALTSSDVTFDDGCSVKYSIKDYILDVLNGEDNGQQELIRALQKYIDSLCKVVKG